MIAEVGSGLNATRPKLLKALSKPQLGFVLVEHRERLARFGFEMVDALLRARGGSVIVLEEREVDDDLVRDMTEVLTSFCARLYLITHNPHPVRSPSRKATRWDRKRLLNRFEIGTKRRAGRQISAERLRCSSNMSFVRNQETLWPTLGETQGRTGNEGCRAMISTSVCVVRPPRADLDVLSRGIEVLARATRMVFARVYQQGEDAARTKRETCAKLGLLARHYSGCRADAIGAVKGWREQLKDQRSHLRSRLAHVDARHEKDYKKATTRRRNAIATRKAETRLARVEAELRGLPRHCFGSRKLLRQGKLAEWRRRRAGNALFAGETGKAYGNEVTRWDPTTHRLELKLPRGLRAVVLEHVKFVPNVEEDLRACIEARTPVSWRVKLLAKGKVELCVTYEEPEPPICTDSADGALALDLNADHIAATLVSGDGRLLDTWRWDLRTGNDNIQNASRLLSLLAATRGVPVVAEDLDFRRKKAWLKQYGRRFAEVLSLFRSKQVLNAVERQCRRRGVELIVVDPAWTTKIAKEGKYPDRYRIGLHHAAALVIGRRGLGFAERVPNTASPLVRAEVKRRGTRGWESTFVQWLPRARRKGGRRGTNKKSGARAGPVGKSSSRPDGLRGATASRAAVGPAATRVHTVAQAATVRRP